MHATKLLFTLLFTPTTSFGFLVADGGPDQQLADCHGNDETAIHIVIHTARSLWFSCCRWKAWSTTRWLPRKRRNCYSHGYSHRPLPLAFLLQTEGLINNSLIATETTKLDDMRRSFRDEESRLSKRDAGAMDKCGSHSYHVDYVYIYIYIYIHTYIYGTRSLAYPRGTRGQWTKADPIYIMLILIIIIIIIIIISSSSSSSSNNTSTSLLVVVEVSSSQKY